MRGNNMSALGTLNISTLNITNLTSNDSYLSISKNLIVNSSITIQNNLTIASSLTVSGLITTNSGTVMIMNTSGIPGSHSVIIDPVACILYSGTGIGIPGTIKTPYYTVNGSDAGGMYNNTPAQYDFWRTYVNLVSGTYIFRLNTSTYPDRGIVSVKINDVQIGTIDTYAGSANTLVSEINNVSISSTGIYKVELQVNSINVSSSGYFFIFKNAALIRVS